MNYALIGLGRMGREIEIQAGRRGHRRVWAVDPAVRARGVRRRFDPEALADVDVAFEFTTPATAAANVEALVEAGVDVVCGTTAWAPGAGLRRQVRRRGVGAVIAPNFSVGMNLFYRLVREASRVILAAGFHDPFLWEAHHRGKADAPSGTARRLAELVAERDPRRPRVVEGNPDGRLPADAFQVASVRAGHEPGSHVVGFDGEFDVIELSHRARGRAGFAIGAVLAAEWVHGRKGLFGFDKVVETLIRAGGSPS